MRDGCTCGTTPTGPRRRVVLTGGPGAGKTAALEVVRAHFCQHVAVLPEAASIVFGGGFPRGASLAARRAAQRAIVHVQNELERWAEDEGTASLTLCDRGLLDGLAYWSEAPASLLAAVGLTRASALARYDLVIHLHTPGVAQGYNHRNPLRTEAAEDALRLDALIVEAWHGHPRRVFIESAADFRDKLDRVIAALEGELPDCCRDHMRRGVACIGESGAGA